MPWIVFSSAHGTTSADCDLSALSIRHAEIVRLKHTYLSDEYLPQADNEAFHRKVIVTDEEDGHVFYHVENAVLKNLNDKLFEDKEISASFIVAYKKLFFEELKHQHEAMSLLTEVHQGGIYSDYKSIRLHFAPRNASEREALILSLQALHFRVAHRFAAEVDKNPELSRWIRSHTGLASDPINWNLAGMGQTHDEASLEARGARRPVPGEVRRKGVPIPPRVADEESRSALELKLLETERLRNDIELELQHFDDVWDHEHHVPTIALLDILRAAQSEPSIHSEEDYLRFMRRRIGIRFSVLLPDSALLRLQRYSHLADELAPSVFIREQEPIRLAPLEDARHGVISFDRAGQNLRNKHSTMRALRLAFVTSREAPEKRDLRRLSTELASEFQSVASHAFDAEKDALNRAITRAGLRGKQENTEHSISDFTASGDDSTLLPTNDVTRAQFSRLLVELSKSTGTPASHRVTSQPQRDATGAVISKHERFLLITEAEGFEKRLRAALESKGIPYKQLQQVLFGIRLQPQVSGRTKVEVFFSTQLDPATADRLTQAIHRVCKDPAVTGPRFHLDTVWNARSAFTAHR